MDLWSGNESVENEVAAPGSDIYVFSRPYHGESRGGDVHYISLCAGGIVTRLMLADVSGHGTAVAETSQALRRLMRRFMNSKSQNRLAAMLNRHFARHAEAGQFATAIVATWLCDQRRLRICNAGHPRPLWYRRAQAAWSFVSEDVSSGASISNLPLGVDAAAGYQSIDLKIHEGDVLVFYTDALTEAHGSDGEMLGEGGLRNIVARLPTDNVRDFGGGVLQAVRAFSGGCPAEDDETIMVLKFSNSRIRTPGFREKLYAYAKVLGLKSV
jgi:serine phosphatase RsbU (regulator of sigma subunit)